jgi:5-hydroxyisourate hydrolase-like protein (transthyretin family)
MAIISTHTLNGVNGSHAGHIPVVVTNLSNGAILFELETDAGGRLSHQIPPAKFDPEARYEMVFRTAKYWRGHGVSTETMIDEIVVRFKMFQSNATYHIPVIMQPHSYSIWKSE